MTDKKEEPFLSGEEISQNQDPDTLRYRDKFDLQYSLRLRLVNTEAHLLTDTKSKVVLYVSDNKQVKYTLFKTGDKIGTVSYTNPVLIC